MRRLLLPFAFLAVSLAAAPEAPDPTAALLAEIIRVDTSNPPGNEGALADLLASKLRPLGVQVEIVPTPQPGKAALFARLNGDGSKRPVLLAAHADVVGVERDKWTVDPFAGLVKDGYVWGRGAIDFKGGMAVFLRAVMRVAEEKVPLARDVIFLAEADEEGARYNTTWLAADHWPLMDCEFALNEGGWIVKDDSGRVRYVSISTADKTSIVITLTARGTSTHASMPLPDNAIYTLARALAKLSTLETPVELTPETREFLLALARSSEGTAAEAFQTLATSRDPVAIARADREASRDPLLHAIIRNTIAPVLLAGGFRSNVIPGSAQATLNVRIIPGTDVDALLASLRRAIDNAAVDVQLANPEAARQPPRPPSSRDTDLYRALAAQAQAAFPGAIVTPYLFQAGTDAGAWRSRGIPVYGIYPYPITADDLKRMHGNDERVSVDSLRDGAQFIYKTLVAIARR